ncbi:substrate-binding domain-containing protein [Cellulosilyticum sp. I15G10I2]|uniref:substrate-binding domain-containing protein n=1 Tax=Cellulosilyticum sp. I15G10I2 TaxID=1892843 RepID=UPI0009F46B6B|nr:substrate-binding domain-containing protein [Cellulosilyticum sp. I15G10I2]
MKKLVKISALLVTSFMMLSSVTYGASKVTAKIDGSPINFDVSPVVEKGTTLVPVKFIAEGLGGIVTTNGNTVKIESADKQIELTIGSKNATVNGQVKTLETAAKTVNGRTLVPLRFISEAFGAKVDFNKSTNNIDITYFSDMKGTLKIGGSTTVQPIAQQVADILNKRNTGLSISVAGGGSGAGIKGAGDGTFNIGLSSRELKDTEKGLHEVIIGKDAIAVVVSKNNPLKSLTKQQIADVFSGKIKNWKEIGGKDAAIFIQTRETGSGTLAAFEELAMAPLTKDAIPGYATPHNSTQLLLQAVAKNENAIGFVSMGYLDNTVHGVNVGGVAATQSNALSGKYPYVRPLMLVTKGVPSGIAAKYINYIRSPKGQQILVSEDYLPIN